MENNFSRRPVTRLVGFQIMALLAAIILGPAVHSRSFDVFVAARGDDRLLHFHLESETGRLTSIGRLSLPGGPAPVCLSPDGSWMYVGLRSTREVAVVRRESGARLVVDQVVPLGLDPVHLAIDRTNDLLIAPTYSGNAWAAFPIRADGGVDARVAVEVEDVPRAHQAVYHADSHSIMIPSLGSDSVRIYDAGAIRNAGRVEAAHLVRLPPGAGPRHLVWHPSAHRFYVVNEYHSTVTAVEWKARDKAPTAIAGVSALPEDFVGKNTGSQIKISPDGRHLYVSNRGHDSIAVFDVDPSGPGLTLKANVPTEPRPRAFELDPSGRWLIAAGQDSGHIALYKRNAATGLLSLQERIPVGNQPMWVTIVPTLGDGY